MILMGTSFVGLFCFFFFIRNTYISLKKFAESVYRDSLEQRRTSDITNLMDMLDKQRLAFCNNSGRTVRATGTGMFLVLEIGLR